MTPALTCALRGIANVRTRDHFRKIFENISLLPFEDQYPVRHLFHARALRPDACAGDFSSTASSEARLTQKTSHKHTNTPATHNHTRRHSQTQSFVSCIPHDRATKSNHHHSHNHNHNHNHNHKPAQQTCCTKSAQKPATQTKTTHRTPEHAAGQKSTSKSSPWTQAKLHTPDVSRWPYQTTKSSHSSKRHQKHALRWISVESALNQRWISVESTLNDHLVSTKLKRSLNVKKTCLKQICVELALNQRWKYVEWSSSYH